MDHLPNTVKKAALKNDSIMSSYTSTSIPMKNKSMTGAHFFKPKNLESLSKPSLFKS